MASSDRSSTMASHYIEHAETSPFRLLDLAAELREEIYYQACAPFPPIDTASIAGTPDLVKIPIIAQLCQQTRKEALAVFFRSRQLLISLNCPRNIERAISWLRSVGADTDLGNTIIIAGTGRYLEPGETYRMTIGCSSKEPYFCVQSLPGASTQTEKACQEIRAAIEDVLESTVQRKVEERKGRFTAAEMRKVIDVVIRKAKKRPVHDDLAA